MDYMSIQFMSTNTQTSQDAIFTLRTPQVSELDQVQALFQRILSTSFPMFPASAIESYQQNWTLSKLRERVAEKRDLFKCIWLDGKPVAILSGTAPEGGVATIIWLLVAEEYRQRALGTVLLDAAIEHYRSLGCHKIKLTVPSDRARHFYLRHGMKEEGYHPNHWWNVSFWALGLDI